jgi:hypothetical protein
MMEYPIDNIYVSVDLWVWIIWIYLNYTIQFGLTNSFRSDLGLG